MDIRVPTKTEAVYERLKEEIIKGVLNPSDRLIIRDIAKRLGVSQIPVREALTLLSTQGMVNIKPFHGATVSELSYKKIHETLFVRLKMEPIAARLAAMNIKKAGINELESILDDMPEAMTQNDLEKYGFLNRAFHKTINKHCGNETMAKIIDGLMESEKRLMMVFSIYPELSGVSYEEHKKIFEMIKNGACDDAEKIMSLHKQRAFDRFDEYLRLRFNEA